MMEARSSRAAKLPQGSDVRRCGISFLRNLLATPVQFSFSHNVSSVEEIVVHELAS